MKISYKQPALKLFVVRFLACSLPYFVCCSVFFNSSYLLAEVLSLKTLIDSVNQHHPEILQSLEDIEARKAELTSAKGSFDPKLYSNNYTYGSGYYSGSESTTGLELPIPLAGSKVFTEQRFGRGTFPVYEDENATLSNGETSFGLEFSLLRDSAIDSRRYGIAQAKNLIEQEKFQLASKTFELQKSAAITYWKWVIQGRIVQILKDLLYVAEKRQVQLDARHASGDIAEFELIDNQRNIFQRQEKIAQEEFLFTQAAQELSIFLRDKTGQSRIPNEKELLKVLPKPYLPDASIQELLTEALKRQPAYQRLKLEAERLELEMKLARNQIMPRLNLKNTVSQDAGSGSASREGTEWKSYLEFEVPFNQRTARGKADLVGTKLRQNQIKQRYYEDQIKVQLQILIDQMKTSRRRVEILTLEAKTTEILRKGEEQRFVNGDSTLLFVAIRELANAEAQLLLVKSLADNLYAKSVLDALLCRAAGD